MVRASFLKCCLETFLGRESVSLPRHKFDKCCIALSRWCCINFRLLWRCATVCRVKTKNLHDLWWRHSVVVLHNFNFQQFLLFWPHGSKNDPWWYIITPFSAISFVLTSWKLVACSRDFCRRALFWPQRGRASRDWSGPNLQVFVNVLWQVFVNGALSKCIWAMPIHYRLRSFKGVRFRFANIASHFICIQILQIDIPFTLYLKWKKWTLLNQLSEEKGTSWTPLILIILISDASTDICKTIFVILEVQFHHEGSLSKSRYFELFLSMVTLAPRKKISPFWDPLQPFPKKFWRRNKKPENLYCAF